ncbi:MAG: hypothetical protein EXR51_00615 [Dehalococcoidia bacterium]|nr:hypothetical protein [Dehalococcoidia bacterium]
MIAAQSDPDATPDTGHHPHHPNRTAEAQAHLDFVIAEFRAIKMTPSLGRALRRKGVLGA